mgnify:CR=1 FL=1
MHQKVIAEYKEKTSRLLEEARSLLLDNPSLSVIKIREAYNFLNNAGRFAKIDPDWINARDLYRESFPDLEDELICSGFLLYDNKNRPLYNISNC